MESREQGLFHAIDELLHHPVRSGGRGYLAFGWPILMLFLVQIVTGILLSFYYESSPEMAYESIKFIMRDITAGWLVRGIHHWAAEAMIVLGLLLLLRIFASGAYTGPNASSWILALVLLLLTFGFAFTGGLLAWDQRAYWSAVTALHWIEAFPLVGPTLAAVLKGGQEVDAPTLSRFYSIHTLILPWLMFYLLLLYLWFRVWRRAAAGTGGAR
jgi:quinol-cytochrome oxidoreductase complex cytochrome b subunit